MSVYMKHFVRAFKWINDLSRVPDTICWHYFLPRTLYMLILVPAHITYLCFLPLSNRINARIILFIYLYLPSFISMLFLPVCLSLCQTSMYPSISVCRFVRRFVPSSFRPFVTQPTDQTHTHRFTHTTFIFLVTKRTAQLQLQISTCSINFGWHCSSKNDIKLSFQDCMWSVVESVLTW